jgi:hypothetical protein
MRRANFSALPIKILDGLDHFCVYWGREHPVQPGGCSQSVRARASQDSSDVCLAREVNYMRVRQKHALAGLAAAALLASGSVGTAFARGESRPYPDKIALGEEEVKQLVLLMDQDKNGKVSEAEFINFMKAEFRRLDKDKSKELDVNELKDSQIRVSHFTDVGK